MNRKSTRSIAAAAASTALLFGLAACGAANEGGDDSDSTSDSELSGILNGGGASAQEAAMNAWRQGFQSAHSDVTVNYDSLGSGGGREQFFSGGLSFAGSDAFVTDEDLPTAQARCEDGDIVQVPVYVSPIAVIFNIEGVDTLQLTPQTLASIFKGDITSWNDEAVAADNPGAELPDTTIVPVHRSDDSGTTENFTEYLSAASGGTWDSEPSQTWPYGGESADGTSGVVSAVSVADGGIGYADASQAGDLGTVDLGVGDSFVPVSPEAAALALESADRVPGRADTDFALEIDRGTQEAGVYPASLISYLITCQTFADEAEADLVREFVTYVVSEEGQAAAQSAAGSAPLSAEFSAEATEAVATISAG